jgi:hypothetical protein
MSAGRKRENESAGKSRVRVRVHRRSQERQKYEEYRGGESKEREM